MCLKPRQCMKKIVIYVVDIYVSIGISAGAYSRHCNPEDVQRRLHFMRSEVQRLMNDKIESNMSSDERDDLYQLQAEI